ncbi:MAG: IS3 family transposase, partial [Lachnospiraceae bacterium]|nr:IS3 family transposase [Lachnospiraceae bacterium]
ENGAMESINGWTKEELLRDFMIKKGENIKDALENYIYYFNNERPASAINYLTPMQYKENFYKNAKLLPAKITDFCTT